MTWERRHKSDAAAIALADRHYSRQTHGTQIGPPGRKLVYVTQDELALWLTHWPDPSMALDGLDAYRCSIFRNEGDTLSSELIVAAMRASEEEWGPPEGGWLTWVDTRVVRSPHPGYCFKQAGWVLDRAWNPARGRRGKIRLTAPAVT